MLWSEGNASSESLPHPFGSVPGWVPAGVTELPTLSGLCDELSCTQNLSRALQPNVLLFLGFGGGLQWKLQTRLSKERGQQGNIQDLPGKSCCCQGADKQFPLCVFYPLLPEESNQTPSLLLCRDCLGDAHGFLEYFSSQGVLD